MFDYSEAKRTKGYFVSQTLDEPITLFEMWELSEVFVALFLILVFGVIFYEWLILILSLAGTLIAMPWVRQNFNKGMIFHFPYSRFGMNLPGLYNPKGNGKRGSD